MGQVANLPFQPRAAIRQQVGNLLRGTCSFADAARHGHSDLFSESQWRTVASRLVLSDRERNIIRAVFDDQKESAIAAQLGTSPHTVHTHLVRLYRKLGLSSRVELVVRIVAEHLSQPSPLARAA